MSEPIHIISLGAGVQSSTVALKAAHGEFTPMPVAAIFADTKAEPKAVYTWLNWLEKQLPFPVHRVTAGSLRKHLLTSYYSIKNQKRTAYGFPAFIKNPDGTQGLMSRQCTRDYKIAPIQKKTTELMREHGSKRAVTWIGISLDEIHRMKPSRRKTVSHRWPLIDARMSRGDCELWMKRNGYPKPPRSACTFCPYRSNKEWKSLTPEEFESAAKFEEKVQKVHATTSMIGVPYLHRQMVPLREADLSDDFDRGQVSMFGNDCEGLCGV